MSDNLQWVVEATGEETASYMVYAGSRYLARFVYRSEADKYADQQLNRRVVLDLTVRPEERDEEPRP